MPPVTRRRSRMLDDATAEGDSSPRARASAPAPAGKDPNPTSPAATRTEKKSLATRAQGEPEDDVARSEGGAEGMPGSDLQRRVRIETDLLHRKPTRPRSSSVPDSQDGSEQDDDNNAPPEPQSASKQLEEEASRHLASQSSEAILLPPGAAEHPNPQDDAKRKHVVFGDDDDVDQYVAAATTGAATPAQNKEEHGHGHNDHDDDGNGDGDDDDNDDDDDEAPEAVSSKVAAKETLESAKAVADAAQKHAASLKRKRQERDELFKQQAEKRKRVQEPPKAEPPTPTENGVEAAAAAAAAKAPGMGRRRADKAKLPSMLPAEYLTDSPSESEDEAALTKVVKGKKAKKINFEDAARSLKREQRAPRDEVVGSTVYRVVADRADKKLAPKMHKDTRHAKEALLQRRRTAVTPNKSKGFFVRK